MIHQIQARYDEEHDRVLLRLSTKDGSEYRFWLTRRFVKRLWPMLVEMLAWDRAVTGTQADVATRQTVLDIQHEGYVQQGDFKTAFEEVPRQLPLGEAPVLAAHGKGSRLDGGRCLLSLLPQQGQGIDITLDNRLLHLLGKLLQEAVKQADWDIGLQVGAPATPQAEVPAAARRLN
jgi:hypothetical protein